jgi:hypothetical protein
MRRLSSSEEWKGDKVGTIRMPIAKVRPSSRVRTNNLITLYQMDWPAEDVEKNVNYFLQVVQRATGNSAEAQAEAKRTGNAKPSESIYLVGCSISSPLDRQPDQQGHAQFDLWPWHLARALINLSIRMP